jgi:hypothetical protein
VSITNIIKYHAWQLQYCSLRNPLCSCSQTVCSSCFRCCGQHFLIGLITAQMNLSSMRIANQFHKQCAERMCCVVFVRMQCCGHAHGDHISVDETHHILATAHLRYAHYSNMKFIAFTYLCISADKPFEYVCALHNDLVCLRHICFARLCASIILSSLRLLLTSQLYKQLQSKLRSNLVCMQMHMCMYRYNIQLGCFNGLDSNTWYRWLVSYHTIIWCWYMLDISI